MNSEPREPLFLHDILSTINELRSFTAGRSFKDYSADPMAQRAVERCVEIISEASRRIPAEWKEEYPHVPWQKMTGIGNVIRHNYDRVDLHTLWLVATQEVEALEPVAQELLVRHTTLD